MGLVADTTLLGVSELERAEVELTAHEEDGIKLEPFNLKVVRVCVCARACVWWWGGKGGGGWLRLWRGRVEDVRRFNRLTAFCWAHALQD